MKVLITAVILLCSTTALAEFRTAKDMQKECRVALQVMQGTTAKDFQNTLFLGECIGFLQGVADSGSALAENDKWYRVCVPDAVSVGDLMQRFVLWVDANPKYTLASTSLLMMLAAQYPCK